MACFNACGERKESALFQVLKCVYYNVDGMWGFKLCAEFILVLSKCFRPTCNFFVTLAV